jgi:hypothetical protein
VIEREREREIKRKKKRERERGRTQYLLVIKSPSATTSALPRSELAPKANLGQEKLTLVMNGTCSI